MQLHQIKPKNKLRTSKRVGRGGKKGTYSGRGMKGQKARSGKRKVPIIRGLIKKYPKLRGYRNKGMLRYGPRAEVNVSKLESSFNNGETVSPKILVEKKLVRRARGNLPRIKILGKGTLRKELSIKNCLVSGVAAKKIKEAGGSIKTG